MDWLIGAASDDSCATGIVVVMIFVAIGWRIHRVVGVLFTIIGLVLILVVVAHCSTS